MSLQGTNKFSLSFFVVGFAVAFFSVAGLAAPLQVVLVGEESAKRVLVPREEVDDAWRSDPSFDDSSWLECVGKPGGIGFDREGDYSRYISLDLSQEMAGRTTCYVRAAFELSAEVLRELDALTLFVRYDDGFVAYLNGERITAANAPTNLHRRAAASQTHEASRLEAFDLSSAIGLLRNGTNLLAVQALNVSGDSPDFLIQFKLIARKNYRNNFVSDLPILVLQSEFPVPPAGADAVVKVIDRGAGNRLTSPTLLTAAARLLKEESPYPAEKADYRLVLAGDAELLGMPAGDKWLLLAPFSDKSLMRTALAAHIAALFGRPAAHSRLCHLFINDDYRGIYVLLESRTVSPNRLPLAVMTPQDNSGDALTGGYLLRLGLKSVPGFDSIFPPSTGGAARVHYAYDTPSPEVMTESQEAYIRNWIEKWEAAANSVDPSYLDLIDLGSFVDYFLLSEICRDILAYRSQTVLYKDRDSRGGRMAIEWLIDARHAFGNTTLNAGNRVEGLQLDKLLADPSAVSDSLPLPVWWKRLRNEPRFQTAVVRRWRNLRSDRLSEENLYAAADSLYRLLSADQVLNFERWMILDQPIPPSAAAYDSYDEAFDDLLLWFFDRLDGLDQALAEFPSNVAMPEDHAPEQKLLIESFPNPFNSAVRIYIAMPYASDVFSAIYDLRGRRVRTWPPQQIPAGEYSLSWDALDDAGTPLPSGVYLASFRIGTRMVWKKLMLLR